MNQTKQLTATLVVYDWYSICGACRKGADPTEPGHITELGYGNLTPSFGCGAVWTAVAPGGKYGHDFFEHVKALQPTLPFVEWQP